MDGHNNLGVPSEGHGDISEGTEGTSASAICSTNPAEFWPVVDLFSGVGGMSLGFSRRPPFRIIAAVDVEHAKPSNRFGSLDCNGTYEANVGIQPIPRNIAELSPMELTDLVRSASNGLVGRGDLTVLLCCPPCTDFSRAKPLNHLRDSPKNSLVTKTADYVEALLPEFVVMENARELIMGRQSHHYQELHRRLSGLGYDVSGRIYLLTRFGLPQLRERAVIIASRVCDVMTLDDLWEGWRVDERATTVAHAIFGLLHPPLEAGETGLDDPMHRCPSFESETVRRRMEAVPRNGGSWYDLAEHSDAATLLTESMKDRLRRRDLGSHCDVYGRMRWDRPAPTIKRECGHVGNGRYCHPEQTRLLSVREMAMLQGFPHDFQFTATSLTNRYRHIGDAVPPLVSYQLSALVKWMKTRCRPGPAEWVLEGSCLRPTDIIPAAALPQPRLLENPDPTGYAVTAQ